MSLSSSVPPSEELVVASPPRASDLAAAYRPLTLRCNFSWTLLGNVVYAACQWGMLVVLAKLGTPEMVGQFALGLAITAPVILFSNLQLRDIQATDAKREYRFQDYLGVRLATIMGALVIIAGISFGAGYRRQTALVILLIGLSKAVEAASDIFYGLLQQCERLDRVALSLIIRGPLSLMAFALGVYLGHGVLWGVVGLVAAWLVVLMAYDIPNGARIIAVQAPNTGSRDLAPAHFGLRSLKPCWHGRQLIRLIMLALPLGGVAMLISLNANIPRYFIEHYGGERQLGIFSAMAYLLVVGRIVVAALAQSASPRLAKHYAGGDKAAFVSLVAKLVIVGGLLGGLGLILAATVGASLLALIYTPEYAQDARVFIWLMAAGCLAYVIYFVNSCVTAARYFKPQLPLSFVVVLATALACFWLVPVYGMIGAAWAIAIAYGVQLVGGGLILLHAMHQLA